MSEELLQAIKCRNCGAPSYSDLKREGFYCPFCGTLMPWGKAGSLFSPEIRFRHMPVGMEDGCFKLGMAVSGSPVRNVFDPDEARTRFTRVDAKIVYLDDETFLAWKNSETVTFTCPDCGNQVSGRGTQNIFECPSCGNKHAKASVLSGEKYAKSLIIGHSNTYLPSNALPFKISREQAIQAISAFVRDYPEIQDSVDDMQVIQAVYLPYRLCDLFLLLQATTEKGSLLLYHNRVNWALPLSIFHDRFLMNSLHPWDFGEIATFRPTMLEGEVRLVGVSRNETGEERGRMLMRDMPLLVKNALAVRDARVDWTQDYTRLHNQSEMMLPVWFLDRKPLGVKSRNDSTAKIAVNGQTGKVSCIIDAGAEKEYLLEKAASFPPELSDESTLFSPPVPVISKPGTFQYRPVQFDKALYNKPGLFSRIFKGEKR